MTPDYCILNKVTIFGGIWVLHTQNWGNETSQIGKWKNQSIEGGLVLANLKAFHKKLFWDKLQVTLECILKLVIFFSSAIEANRKGKKKTQIQHLTSSRGSKAFFFFELEERKKKEKKQSLNTF